MGFRKPAGVFYRRRLLSLVREPGFEVPDPRDIGIGIPGPGAEKVRDRLNVLVGGRNGEAIESSDGVLAVSDVDIGTAFETGCALVLGKKILGCRGDFHLTGDSSGSAVNLQVEYFRRKSGGGIVSSVEDLDCAPADVFSG